MLILAGCGLAAVSAFGGDICDLEEAYQTLRDAFLEIHHAPVNRYPLDLSYDTLVNWDQMASNRRPVYDSHNDFSLRTPFDFLGAHEFRDDYINNHFDDTMQLQFWNAQTSLEGGNTHSLYLAKQPPPRYFRSQRIADIKRDIAHMLEGYPRQQEFMALPRDVARYIARQVESLSQLVMMQQVISGEHPFAELMVMTPLLHRLTLLGDGGFTYYPDSYRLRDALIHDSFITHQLISPDRVTFLVRSDSHLGLPDSMLGALHRRFQEDFPEGHTQEHRTPPQALFAIIHARLRPVTLNDMDRLGQTQDALILKTAWSLWFRSAHLTDERGHPVSSPYSATHTPGPEDGLFKLGISHFTDEGLPLLRYDMLLTREPQGLNPTPCYPRIAGLLLKTQDAPHTILEHSLELTALGFSPIWHLRLRTPLKDGRRIATTATLDTANRTITIHAVVDTSELDTQTEVEAQALIYPHQFSGRNPIEIIPNVRIPFMLQGESSRIYLSNNHLMNTPYHLPQQQTHRSRSPLSPHDIIAAVSVDIAATFTALDGYAIDWTQAKFIQNPSQAPSASTHDTSPDEPLWHSR